MPIDIRPLSTSTNFTILDARYLTLDQTMYQQTVLGEIKAGQFYATGYGTYNYYGGGDSYFGGSSRASIFFSAGGTNLAPAFSVDTDTDTGMFFPASDTISFSTAGTERARITSTGLFGINGTALTLLDVIGGQGTFRNAVGATTPDATGNIQLYDTTSMAASVGGGIAFFGNYSGTTATVAAGIKALKSNATSGQCGFDLGFYTRLHGGSNTGLGMKLTSTSNLQLGGASTETGRLNIDYSSGGATTWVDLKTANVSAMQLRYYGSSPWEEFEFYIPKSNAGMNFKTDSGGLRIVPWTIGGLDILYFQATNQDFTFSSGGGVAGRTITFSFATAVFTKGNFGSPAPAITSAAANFRASMCISDASSYMYFFTFGGANYLQCGTDGTAGGQLTPFKITGSQGYPEMLVLNSTQTYTPQDFGAGSTAPAARIHAIKTTEQLRLGYNTTNYLSATVGSTGSTTFALTGTTPIFTYSQSVTFSAGITLSTQNIVTDTTTGTQIATGDTQKLGFFGATPVVRQAHIADAKTNYAAGELDTEAEIISAMNATNTTINGILAKLETLGFLATS